jgi:hypothetical protein
MTGRDDHRALQERMHSCRVSGSYLLGMKCTFPRKEVRIKHGMLHQRRSARRRMTRIVRIDNHQLVGRLLIDVGVPSRVITSAVANDVIELANDQLPDRTRDRLR